jgi:hypothetical protein
MEFGKYPLFKIPGGPGDLRLKGLKQFNSGSENYVYPLWKIYISGVFKFGSNGKALSGKAK